MEIIINVAREKIRRKMLYITTILGIIVVMVFSTDMGSLTIDGRLLNDYYVLIPILINVVNFLAGAIALAMSVSTIPNEYERRTSHLIWSRGISQSRYHMNLALGNALISWLSGIILYITLGVFAVVDGYSDMLGYIGLAALIMLIYTAIICMLTTALSIKLPPIVTGIIMIVVFVGGAFRNILILISATATGMGGTIIKRIIKIMGLLIIGTAGLGILFFRRKEA